MKVEFDGTNFTASMNSDGFSHKSCIDKRMTMFWEKRKPLILGIIALFFSLVNLPYGLFATTAYDLMQDLLGASIGYWITVMFVFASVMLAISVTLAILSIVAFAKKSKDYTDIIGLTLSVLSFAVSVTCLVLNIVALISH